MTVIYISDSLKHAVVLTHKLKHGNERENVFKVCRVIPRKSEKHWPAEKRTYPWERPAIERCEALDKQA